MQKKKNAEWIKELPQVISAQLEEEFNTKGFPGCGLLDDESYSLWAAMGHLRHNSSHNRGYFWHGVGIALDLWDDGKDSRVATSRFWYNPELNQEGIDFAKSCMG